jgi:hypothetical protein
MLGGVRTVIQTVAGAARRQVVRDLHPGRAGSDDHDLLAHVRRRVAVLGRVRQVTGEAVPTGPVGDVRRVHVARRDDHLTSIDVAGRRPQHPAAGPRFDPVHRGVEPQLDAVLVRVPVEMGHDVVAARAG